MSSLSGKARLAGLLYLAVTVVGVFSLLYIPSLIYVPGDAAATAHNIASHEALFRTNISWRSGVRRWKSSSYSRSTVCSPSSTEVSPCSCSFSA
jgi:hypothetical protein